jgi:SAM-dependent methyltransferase
VGVLKRLERALKPWPKHPLDKTYGIETSSKVRRFQLLTADPETNNANNGYGGSQPSIIRKTLDVLPPLNEATFIDLGCGKGRVNAVASEYPFRRNIGVELSHKLCEVTQRNSALMKQRFPDRPEIEVVEGDASRPEIPQSGDVVLFLCNSFRAPLVARLIEHIHESWRPAPGRRLFFVYYNPVHAHLFDADPWFQRYSAELHDFAPEEATATPFPNKYDSIVVWQGQSDDMAPPRPGADRPVDVLLEDFGCIVRM